MKKYLTILFVLLVAYSFGAEHSKKLKYRKNSTTTEIKLYTTTTEVGGDRIALQDNSTTVYAKLGSIVDANRSDLRIMDGAVTKSILLSAGPYPYLAIVGEFTTASGSSMGPVIKYENSTFYNLNTTSNIDFLGVYGCAAASNTKDLYFAGRFSTPNKNCARVLSGENITKAFGGTGIGSYPATLIYDTHVGRSSGWIYFVGANAANVDGTPCGSIAAWDPASETWHTFGSGFPNGGAYACTEDTQGNLYVGGTFTTVSGLANTGYIAKWTRSTQTWSKLGGGMNNHVHSLESDENDNIYAAGIFTAASGTSATGCAMWESSTSTWRAMKGGISGALSKVAILVHPTNGLVYFGGEFGTVDGVSGYGNIAQWNPTTQTWSKLGGGTGLNDIVHSRFTVDTDGNLYVGGDFTTVNGVSGYNRLAKWNPTTQTWSKLGGGVNARVHGLFWVAPTN